MKKLKRFYYKIFKTYKVLETKLFSYAEADKILLQTNDKPEGEKWVLAKEEDYNRMIGTVYLCRKIRVIE